MLSIAILTGNAADKLRTLLPTLHWADEIVVIDDNSTDSSQSIARKFKAKFVRRPLDENFAAKRNLALNVCQEEWVLFLDSDEKVPKVLQQEIIQKLKHNPQVNGFTLGREDIFLGRTLRFGETGTTRLLRLGRRTKGVWIRPVHEVWELSPVGHLNHPLLHYPHPTIASFLEKINRYTTIDARFRHHQGESFSLVTLLLFPLGKFVTNYIVKLGFLDGFPGLIMAYFMSLHSMITRIKLYEEEKAHR